MYFTMSKWKFTDENNISKCKYALENCLTCPTVAYNKELYTKFNDNYYPMENDPSNLGEYINCYNEHTFWILFIYKWFII